MSATQTPLKKVLLITYYWPPSGGAGVYRWLRMSKYFKENGYELIVYRPENANYVISDEALEAQVPKDIKTIQRSILEPASFMKSNTTQGSGFISEKEQSMSQKLMIWVRGNLFIPDARMFWIAPSIRFLSKYLRKNKDIQNVISTYSPHSNHLIAKALKRKFNLHWVADFRDPWTGIDFYDELKIGKWADKRQKSLERSVLTKADHVTTVSKSIVKELKSLGGKNVHEITNGYTFDFDFEEPLTKEFTIAHFGSMMESRNPHTLWKVLNKLSKDIEGFKQDLKIRLFGNVDYKVLNNIEENQLTSNLEVVAQVPHNESIKAQRSSQLLLLVVNNAGNVEGTLTGKFFEYLSTKRPIFAVDQKRGFG